MPHRLSPPSRRQQYSSATKRALVSAAGALFADHGYAATSLDAIVARARVTKGALYHHFTGKQGIFEAVFTQVEADAVKRIRKATKGSRDPWEKALRGLRTFLKVVQEPEYQRIVVLEGPAILGYERFREKEERTSFSLIEDLVRGVLRASDLEMDAPMVATFSRIFMGALTAAGEAITGADDTPQAVARIEAAITFILTGMRSLAESGVRVPDPADLVASYAEDAEDAD